MTMQKDMKKRVKKAAKATAWDPMKVLNNWGVRSGHAYTAGLFFTGITLLSVLGLRRKGDEKNQPGRLSTFAGQLAPTFFAIGLGLKHEEKLL